ncbi:MAG: hypothetical protein JRJ87_25520 [Deltaproteobacteria bacterium]|nr:hypothetical protein [Deltaproteobacteria bacterium]
MKLRAGECTQEEHDNAAEAFFAWQRKSERLDVLQHSDDGQMLELKHRLLQMLRKDDIYVLERGAIEQYYPDTVKGADKPSKAQDFCEKVASPEAILACCGEQTVYNNGEQEHVKEFDLICRGIFQRYVS